MEVREDHFLPVRDGAGDGVLEGLGARDVAVRDAGIAGIELRVALVILGEGQRGDVVAAAPDLDLGVAVLLGGLGLVESLEVAVVLFVEAPALLDRNPVQVHFVQDVVEGLDRPLEVGGIGLFEGEAFRLEQFAGLDGLVHAFGAEVHVGPARETVFLVPDTFAVPDEYDSFHIVQNNECVFLKKRGKITHFPGNNLK